MRVLPPSQGCSAAGSVTEPSACCPFSSTAIRQRPTASPDPFSVARNSGLPPPSGRNRPFIRRAWNVPQVEQDEISRYAFWPGSQTSMSCVFWLPKPMSPVHSTTVR